MEPTVVPAQSGVDGGASVVGHALPLRCCLLAIGQEILALDLDHVREVFRIESITPVPGTPAVLVGVANLRGTVIPVADLRVLMGKPRSSKLKYAAVLGQGGGMIGVLIDDVPEIQMLDQNESEGATPDDTGNDRPFFSRRIRVDGRSGGVVDPAKLLAILEHMSDRHAQGFMPDKKGTDNHERAVIQDEHRTTSDGEENDHGKV